MVVGVAPEDYTQASPELLVVDLTVDPTVPSFVLRRYAGAGGSPAIVGSSLYSVGTLGLVALGPTPADLDVNGDGTVGTGDLYAWERGVGSLDVNTDGTVNAEDRAELISSLRATGPAAMSGARE